VKDRLLRARVRLSPGSEASRATDYWASLPDYHLGTDDDPKAIERSRWLADDVVPRLGITSLLELGTNTGRNLEIIKERNPAMSLRGTDVNPRALEVATSKQLDVDFALADVNKWEEAAKGWDAILTMSVLDHVPEEAIGALADNIVATARKYVIAVELWDGSPGTRGHYKYSRNTEQLFRSRGLATVEWDVATGQYDPRTASSTRTSGNSPSREPWRTPVPSTTSVVGTRRAQARCRCSSPPRW